MKKIFWNRVMSVFCVSALAGVLSVVLCLSSAIIPNEALSLTVGDLFATFAAILFAVAYAAGMMLQLLFACNLLKKAKSNKK